jgi:hypothetical protein
LPSFDEEMTDTVQGAPARRPACLHQKNRQLPFHGDRIAAAQPASNMNHTETDRVSLELARRVAARLRWQPQMVDFARGNLVRWSRQNASAPSLLRCYAEWQQILSRSVEEICELLCSESDNAQRLRQNSPFAGVLSPAEVWEVKARFRHAPATT